MLRTAGLRRAARLPRPRTSTIRYNSSHPEGHNSHTNNAHATFPPPLQGDGKARTPPSLLNHPQSPSPIPSIPSSVYAYVHISFPSATSDTYVGLMSPGIRTTLIWFGVTYAFYCLEKYLMAKNGRGIIHGWLTDKVDKGWTQEEYYARIEGARQTTKEHYEFSQRPIIRTNHPEYFPPPPFTPCPLFVWPRLFGPSGSDSPRPVCWSGFWGLCSGVAVWVWTELFKRKDTILIVGVPIWRVLMD